MKLSKQENIELPDAVRDALCSLARDEENILSKRDLDNAWIKFNNLLDAETPLRRLTIFERLGQKFSAPYLAVPGFALAAAISFFIYGNIDVKQEQAKQFAEVETPVAEKMAIAVEAMEKPRGDFDLPKAERFSELVRFVKEDAQNLVPQQRSELDQRLSARLSAEIEHSLKNSFQFNTNNDTPHLVFVAND